MLPRRAVLGLLLSALGGAPRAAMGAGPAPLAPDIRRIRDRGRLVVAAAAFDLPPFVEIGAGGTPAGSDIDLARGMARALGVALAVDRRARSFDELLDLVQHREADLALSRLSETLAGATRVRFSRPYLVLRQALLLNRLPFAQLAQGADPLAVLDTPRATIGVVAGTAAPQTAQHLLPQATLREFPRWQPDLVEAVLRNEVAAGLVDELQARLALTARPDAPLHLRMTMLEDAPDRLAAAVPWDSDTLLAWIDLYLGTEAPPMTVDGLLARTGRSNHFEK